MKNEIKLGIFTAAGIAAVILSIMMAGGLTFERSYKVHMLFNDAAGMPPKAKVKIAGVDIGSVTSIELDGQNARVNAKILNRYALYENASVKIVAIGIIGTKYIEVMPGDSSHARIKDGGTITGEYSKSLDAHLTNVAGKLEELLTTLTTDGPNGNFAQNIAETIANLKRLSGDMAQMAADNKQDVRAIITEIRDISQKLDSIVTKIDSGTGTLGKLINDEEMGDELKESVASIRATSKGLEKVFARTSTLEIDWEYTGRFDTRDSTLRSDLGLRIKPTPNKFYYIGISNAGNTSNVSSREADNMNKIDALMGFRGKNAEIYGGMMRTNAGAGIGYAPFGDMRASYVPLQFNIDAFNFDDAKRNHFQLNMRAQFGITRWLYAGVAYEDIWERPSFMPYLRLVIKDEDIASLFGVAGVAVAGSQ
jgi:phospholipid/cholesterol/gamma-HCH transport system substrate-binding protein